MDKAVAIRCKTESLQDELAKTSSRKIRDQKSIRTEPARVK